MEEITSLFSLRNKINIRFLPLFGENYFSPSVLDAWNVNGFIPEFSIKSGTVLKRETSKLSIFSVSTFEKLKLFSFVPSSRDK